MQLTKVYFVIDVVVVVVIMLHSKLCTLFVNLISMTTKVLTDKS